MKPLLINSTPSLISVIFLYFLIILAICQISPRQTSEQLYVVKFNKMTEEERQKIDANREVISQGEFLQKLISFTPVDSEPAIFFVKYNSIVNASRGSQKNKDNSIKANRTTSILLQVKEDKNVIALNTSQIKPVKSNLINFSSTKTVQQLKQSNNAQTLGPNATQKTTWQPKVILQDNIELRRPIIQKKIVNSQFKGQFQGLDLYHKVPTVFIKNQVFLFMGNVTNTSLIYFPAYLVQAVMIKDGVEKIKCEQFVTKNNTEFQLSCRMSQTGTYKLVIRVGFVQFSNPKKRQIIQPDQKISLTAIPKTPEGLYIELIQNVLYIGWLTTSSLSRLTFLQRGRSKQYLLSNYHYRFRIPFADFLLFESGQMKVLLDHAQSIDGTYHTITSNFGDKLLYIFKAMTHGHSDNDQDSYKIEPKIPWQIKVNETIYIKTTFKSKLKNQVYFISPYGQIQKKYIDHKFSSDHSAQVNANTPLEFNISFQLQGTNVIEINLADGAAAVNQPVYVGDGYPFLPDFKDIVYQAKLNNQDYTKALREFVKVRYGQNPNFPIKQQPNYNATIAQKRQFLMNLLNLFRAVQIVQPVYLDELLSQIAQLHCEDMKKQSYFSHINKKNEGPSERAKKINFNFVLGQNLAQRETLIEAHLSLTRSAIHFENSIDKIWTRVGLGICQRSTGQYITVYDFSTRDTTKFPLNSYQLLGFKKQLVDMIQRKYKKKQRGQFSNIVLQWMLSPREITLNYYVKDKNAGGMIVDYNCLQFIFYPLFISEFENSSNMNKMITKDLLYSNTFAVNIIQSRADKDLLQLCFGGVV